MFGGCDNIRSELASRGGWVAEEQFRQPKMPSIVPSFGQDG